MKISDLTAGDHINHPRKGLGTVINLGMRTVVVKYKNSTTRTVFFKKDVEFNISEL